MIHRAHVFSAAIAALCVAVAVAVGVAHDALAPPGSCPAGVQTMCPPTAACCPIFMSSSGYGCCEGLGPNAVCCGQQACCPAGYTCINTPPYVSVCAKAGSPNASATQVCTPGPQHPPSTTQPSVIVIGDSVSVGYTPAVIALMNATAQVQHSPWAGYGAADDVGNGVHCEEYFLRTAMYEPARWSLISFNFGLHNLDNSSAAEQQYAALLTNFTDRLVQTGSKLVFVTTTPFMPDHLFGNYVVEDLNAIARRIMAARSIPVADLYQHVINYCGTSYKNCSICDNEYNNQTGVTCGYHYTSEGYNYLASFLAPIYTALLK